MYSSHMICQEDIQEQGYSQLKDKIIKGGGESKGWIQKIIDVSLVEVKECNG